MNNAQLQMLFQQARRAFDSGQLDVALRISDQLIGIAGQREEFLNIKSLSLMGLGRLQEACSTLERALKKNPRSAGLHMNAARIDIQLAKPRNAKRHAMETVKLAKNNPRALYQAAIICRQTGDQKQALKLARQCQKLAPEIIAAWHLDGSVLLDMGEPDQAAEVLFKTLEIEPLHAKSLADLSRSIPESLDPEELFKSLGTVADSARSPQDRSTALFALADRAHRDGNLDEAARLYVEANKAGAITRPFNLEQWEEKQRKTLDHYSQLEPVGEPGQGAGAKLVFLVGMPRSGTSLAEQVIGSHPEVLACGELVSMHAIEYHSKSAATLEDKRRHYLSALPVNHAQFSRVSDKLPMNFERIGLIHQLFPGARIIHCQRHPLDTALSCFQQDFQSGVKWAFNLDSIARVIIAEREMMQHWAARLPDHVFGLPYESVVDDLPTQASALATFLDLEMNPAMAEPHRSKRLVATASRLQVRQPVYQSSVEKWRNYEDLLAPVIERLTTAGFTL